MFGWVEGGGEQGGVDVDGCAYWGVFVEGEFFDVFPFVGFHLMAGSATWVST